MPGRKQKRNVNRLLSQAVQFGIVWMLALSASGCGAAPNGPPSIVTAPPLQPANTQALAIPPTVTPGGPDAAVEPTQPEVDWPTEAPWPTETTAVTFPAPTILASSTAAPAQATATQAAPTQAAPTQAVPTQAAPSQAVPTQPAPTAAPLPTLAPQPDQALSQRGPWLLFTDGKNNLWAANPDGSGATRINTGGADVRLFKASPSGSLAALVTADPSSLNNLKLQILSLPDGALKVVTDLMPSGFHIEGSERTALVEAAEAVVLDNLDWSADGQRLAFIGAQNGRSADVYTYTPATGAIVRLTDGPSQAYQPRWSPDGRYVVHTGVETFGSGAGYQMAGVWAARADGSGSVTLYVPGASSGDEKLLGWPNASNLLVSSWNPGCDTVDLRTVSLANGSTAMLWKGGFQLLAQDPAGQAVLISVRPDQVQNCQANQAGTFLIRAGQPPQAVNIAVSSAAWSPEQNAFLMLSGEQAWMLKPDGSDPQPLPSGVTGLPVYATGSQRSAWINNGVWVMGVGQPARKVLDQASRLVWSPDGSVLFIFTPGGLYAASAPGFAPRRLNTELNSDATGPPEWAGLVGSVGRG